MPETEPKREPLTLTIADTLGLTKALAVLLAVIFPVDVMAPVEALYIAGACNAVSGVVVAVNILVDWLYTP